MMDFNLKGPPCSRLSGEAKERMSERQLLPCNLPWAPSQACYRGNGIYSAHTPRCTEQTWPTVARPLHRPEDEEGDLVGLWDRPKRIKTAASSRGAKVLSLLRDRTPL